MFDVLRPNHQLPRKVIAVSLFCLFALSLFVSQPSQAEQQGREQEGVTLALEDADIGELVRWASDKISKTIVIHPNVKGRVSVIAGEPLNPAEAYEVFLSVLQVHGFSVIESENTIKVIPDAIAKSATTPVIDGGEQVGYEDVVVRVIKVKNVSAPQLVALIRPLIPQVGHLAAYPNTNVLIVADRASNIDRVVKIIDRIDRVGTIDIEVVNLQHANAKDVVQVINKLIAPSAGSQAQNAENVFRLTADERSNAILMTGDPITRQQVKRLLERLDSPLAGDGNTQVIYLNYAKAIDMVPVLEGISGSLQKSEKEQPFSNTEVSIQASEENNALIITAPPELLSTMKGVIAKLDIRRAQVLVEALIVEVNNDLLNSLGVAWKTDSVAGDGVVGGFRTFSSDSSIGNPSVLNDFGPGLTLGYLRNTDLRALINFLATDSAANILSTPTILTLDNQEAEILVGSNVPFVTGSFTTDGNTSDNPFQTVDRQDIGVTLKVTPTINEADSLSLDIEQTVESIANNASSAVTADFVTNKRQIKTKVLVNNNQVLVLGGLIEDTIIESRNKVPILGDIPLLGALFRSNNAQTVKNNLMVFIHPVILRDELQGTEATSGYYEKIRGQQIQLNKNTEHFYFPKERPLLPELENLNNQSGSEE